MAFCQNSSYYTIDECLELIKDSRATEALPSLYFYKDSLEKNETLDEEKYTKIIMALLYHYQSINDFSFTRKIYDSAIVVLNDKSKQYNIDLRRQLYLTRGTIEYILKNYSTAASYLQYAKGLYEEANDYGVSYMVMLHQLAMVYLGEDNLLLAKLYMDEFIEYYKKKNGNIFETKQPTDFLFLNNYGTLCFKFGETEIAEKCFLHIINESTTSGNDTPNNAIGFAFTNYIDMLFSQKRYKELKDFLTSYSKLIPDSTLYNPTSLQELTLANLFLHNHSKAEFYLTELNNVTKKTLLNNILDFPEDERENYWLAMTANQLSINNHVAFQTQNPQIVAEAYNNALFYKNISNRLSYILKKPQETANETQLKLYKDYKKTREIFSYKSNSELKKDSLRMSINHIEKSILNSIGDKDQTLSLLTTTWEEVRSILTDDEIAIEFCMIPFLDSNSLSSRQYYGAYILRSSYSFPKMITIGPRYIIDSLINVSDSTEMQINEMYLYPKSNILYKKIWEPILPYLKGIKKIYYSPTDAITLINLEILQPSSNKMMVSDYSMYRLSSTGIISKIKQDNQLGINNAILYGNINYYANLKEMQEQSMPYLSYTGTFLTDELATRSSDSRGNLKSLPYSESEIKSIANFLQKNGVKVKLITGLNANEESFKALDGVSPDIIHIATHGFAIYSHNKNKKDKFVPSTSIYSNKEAYMMWTGLLMAGSNNVWNGRFNLNSVEDGVLTADEISRLDLSNTKMVVLSACETARGLVDPVDGVLGLQRAFKEAGAGTIVMSLWEVQDEATSMLMSLFYKYIIDGIEKHAALNKAMMDVRKEFKDPYYWAGFIMLD